MKILIVTDLHSQRAILTRLDNHLSAQKYDAVFACGDISDRYDTKDLAYATVFIDLITKNHHLPLFLVHGNNESEAVKLLYQQRGVSVHLHPQKMHAPGSCIFVVVGVGYGEEFPQNTNFAKGKILLTHEPPRADTLRQMEKIEFQNAPLVHFAGHLHRIAKIWRLKNSLFVQVPTAQNFQAAVLELPKVQVSFINF